MILWVRRLTVPLLPSQRDQNVGLERCTRPESASEQTLRKNMREYNICAYFCAVALRRRLVERQIIAFFMLKTKWQVTEEFFPQSVLSARPNGFFLYRPIGAHRQNSGGPTEAQRVPVYLNRN